MSTPQPLLRRPAPAFVLDVLLVLAFAAVGRASHSEGLSLVGILETAWPFLVGALAGWAVVRGLRKGWPTDVGPGITVWFVTMAVGMLLRLLTGQGTALPFVGVAALTLAVLLIGWRALVAAALRGARP